MTRRSALLPLLLLLALVTPVRAGADPVCPPPRCVDVTVPVSAGLTVPESRARVLLPPGYDTRRAYPVLYLLHGAGDTFRTWTTNTDVVAFSSAFDIVIVMPDSGRNADAGWYSDWIDGSRHWESFHIGDLVRHIEATFSTNGRRAIAGLSMGGFGAMSYAARHPGMFAAAASFSGALDMMYGWPGTGPAFTLLHERFGTPDDRIWGNQTTNAATWRAHNPTDLAAALRGTALFLATGNGAPGGPHEDPGNVGGYGVEHGVWQMNLSFVRALDAAGVAHTDWFYGPGQHSWPYWQAALHWALPQLLASL